MTLLKKQTSSDSKLDKKTIVEIKEGLLTRKKQIEKELKNIANKGEHALKAKFPQYGDTLEDNAQEVGEYSTSLATEKVLENTLRDINGALERIKKGTYGVCKYCKQDIGKKRMMARPVASACIKCKTKLQSAV